MLIARFVGYGYEIAGFYYGWVSCYLTRVKIIYYIQLIILAIISTFKQIISLKS